jgi:hypothetical protein
VSSGPFVTTTTDIVGFFAFLGNRDGLVRAWLRSGRPQQPSDFCTDPASALTAPQASG